MLSATVQRDVEFLRNCGKMSERKRCFLRTTSRTGQVSAVASSTTLLPPLLLNSLASVSFITRLSLLSAAGRLVVKLSSPVPKWVNVYLQLAGAGSSPKYAEDSAMSVCTGEIAASLLSAEEVRAAF